MLNAHALHAAARGVATRIGPVEEALDDSLAKAANLLASCGSAWKKDPVAG